MGRIDDSVSMELSLIEPLLIPIQINLSPLVNISENWDLTPV